MTGRESLKGCNMSNNHYRRVEKLLYNYKMIKVNIENNELEIEYLKNEDGMKGISYDGISTSPTNEFKSATEDIALSNAEKIHYLQHIINKDKRLIDSIDRSLGGLTEKERKIIEQKYLDGKQWGYVASMLDLSESTAKRYRRNAINKLVVGIYGRN